MNKCTASTKNNRGFTLIEILIVVTILGLLIGLVGPKMFSKVGKSKQKVAKAQISMFETALDTYRLDIGKYPTSDLGLNALREKPADLKKWDGPYLPKEIPLDPWGNEYVYQAPGEHGELDLISLGADGQPGGEKEDSDIVSWKNLD